MSSYKRDSKRVWKKFVRWSGFGKGRTQKQPTEHIPLQQGPNKNDRRAVPPSPTRTAHPAYQRVPSSSSTGTEQPLVIPELAHLNAERRPRKSRLSFFHRAVVEEEEPQRGSTPLLANRKIYAQRRVVGQQSYVAHSSDEGTDGNESDEDDDRPVAYHLPRGCKLVNTPSRNHLTIVRKSAMSPLNGCDNAPPNQGRRTPAPLLMPTVSEGQRSIDEFAMPPMSYGGQSRLHH